MLREGIDLSFYLSQAANVAAALRGGSAVGRIPQETDVRGPFLHAGATADLQTPGEPRR